MGVLNLRKRVGVLLLACGVLMVLTYGFAIYLIYQRNHVSNLSKNESVQPADDTERLLATADQYLSNRKVEQALLKYREVLSRDPRSTRAQLGLAKGELMAGREDVAGREYERVLKLDGCNSAAVLQLGRIYSHQRPTWPRSEARYREYLRLFPNDAETRLALGRVLAWQGKAAKAADLYAMADVQKLMTAQDQKDYAFALVKLGRFTQAEPLLKRLRENRPDDTGLSLQLAAIYASRKDWDSSLALYRSLLARKPNDPHLNLTYGLELMAVKNYKVALVPLERARDAMPANGQVGLAYARALKESGDLKSALREYGRVIPWFDRNASVLREYADALLEKRDYRKSTEYYQAAYRLGLRDDRLLLGLAGALSGQGKDRAALPYLEELYRRAPTDRVAFELAKLMHRLGRDDRARRLLQQVESSRLRASASQR